MANLKPPTLKSLPSSMQGKAFTGGTIIGVVLIGAGILFIASALDNTPLITTFQKIISGQPIDWTGKAGSLDASQLQGSPSGGSSITPTTQYGPGEQPNPKGCTNNVNATTSPWPPFQGLDKNGCCPDGFSRWDIGGGVIVCRNMWNIKIG